MPVFMLFAGYLVYQNYDQLRNSCGGGGGSGNILTEYDDPINAIIRWSSEDVGNDDQGINKSDSDLVTDAGVRSSTSTTTTKSRQKGTVRKKQRRGTQKESNNNKSNVSSKRRGKEQEANRIRGKAEERKEETNSSRSRTSTEDTPQHRIFDLLDDDDGADSARMIINGNPTKTKNGRNRCRSNTRSNSISSRSETQRRTSSKGSSSKKPYRHSRPPLYICTDTADDQEATPAIVPAWTPAAESGSGSSASSESGSSFRRNNTSSPTHTTAVAVNIDKYWSDRSAV